jgi:hypothetical protein
MAASRRSTDSTCPEHTHTYISSLSLSISLSGVLDRVRSFSRNRLRRQLTQLRAAAAAAAAAGGAAADAASTQQSQIAVWQNLLKVPFSLLTLYKSRVPERRRTDSTVPAVLTRCRRRRKRLGGVERAVTEQGPHGSTRVDSC